MKDEKAISDPVTISTSFSATIAMTNARSTAIEQAWPAEDGVIFADDQA